MFDCFKHANSERNCHVPPCRSTAHDIAHTADVSTVTSNLCQNQKCKRRFLWRSLTGQRILKGIPRASVPPSVPTMRTRSPRASPNGVPAGRQKDSERVAGKFAQNSRTLGPSSRLEKKVRFAETQNSTPPSMRSVSGALTTTAELLSRRADYPSIDTVLHSYEISKRLFERDYQNPERCTYCSIETALEMTESNSSSQS